MQWKLAFCDKGESAQTPMHAAGQRREVVNPGNNDEQKYDPAPVSRPQIVILNLPVFLPTVVATLFP